MEDWGVPPNTQQQQHAKQTTQGVENAAYRILSICDDDGDIFFQDDP